MTEASYRIRGATGDWEIVVGMEVHDVGGMRGELEVGMAFTIEPGLYEDETSIGVRIEHPQSWIDRARSPEVAAEADGFIALPTL